MIVVNFGGGKNSTAMLIEAVARDERPDLILFADTGGEKPETYAHVERFSAWLVERGAPAITVVHCQREDGIPTLEEECVTNATLPSKAFGFSGCSVKWKVQPQDKYLSEHPPVLAAWARGERVERWLGFHADEPHRAAKRAEKDATDTKWLYRYPLIEWGLDQQDCQDILAGAGFDDVEKSSCFFCPAMKRWEIRRLERRHPDLLSRALRLEAIAKPGLREKEGLGGHFAWSDYLRQPEIPFGACDVGGGPELCDSCYDGD